MVDQTAKTSIPDVVFDDSGLILPTEKQLLDGIIADWQAAFGGTLNFYDANGNFDTSLPQSQLVMSLMVVMAKRDNRLAQIVNNLDPATSTGVYQDGIGNINFISRLAGTPTVVSCVLKGSPGFTVEQGSEAYDINGNAYTCDANLTFDGDGNAKGDFTCTVLGPTVCAPNTLNQPGVITDGWSSITNPTAGVIGQEVETPEAFERRRQATIEKNAIGTDGSVLAALYAVEGVAQAYVYDNAEDYGVTISGINIPANSLYCVVLGGKALDIANAIRKNKSNGCPTFGDTIQKVIDDNPLYEGNGPTYSIRFDQAQEVDLYVDVALANSEIIPDNAADVVKQAVVNYYQQDDTQPKINGAIFASSLIPALEALGDWVNIISITVGLSANPTTTFTRANLNQILVASLDKVAVNIQEIN